MSFFPKYPTYKDSGVEWLGEVPEHWEVKRGRYLFTETNERSLNGSETHLSMSQRYGLVPADQLTAKSLQSESYEGAKLCYTGDIVLNRLKAHLGVFAVAKQDGVISPDYSVFRLRQVGHQPQYFESLFKTPAYLTAFNKAVRGIVVGFYRLYTGDFFDIPFLVPPKSEQDRIVAFLDEKTAQIDALIAKKQRQIELLDEQKAILINRAVTRGIGNGELRIVNEDAAQAASDHSTFTIQNSQFKDSGVPWIGAIPKGWRVVPLRYLLSEPLTNGLFKTKQFFGEGTRLVNVGDVYAKDNVITPSALERVRANGREKASYQVQKGDIFFVRSSLKLEGTGASSMMPDCDEDTVFECHVIRGRPKSSVVEPEYLIRYLNAASVRSALVAGAKTVTMSTLDQQAFLRLPILVPPKEEQKTICEALRAMFEKFNQAKHQIESQIQTLQTLRSALIAHAVTGKMKVS